jgi:hypothetical protein
MVAPDTQKALQDGLWSLVYLQSILTDTLTLSAQYDSIEQGYQYWML